MAKPLKSVKIKLLIGLIFLQLIFLSNGQYSLVKGADLPPNGVTTTDIDPNPDLASSGLEGPTLSIIFDDNVDDGVKMNALAITKGFNNDDSWLYFTWYLKKAGCELNDSPSSTNKAKCDKDNDGKVTENDWKIEAAKIIAARGYAGESNGNASNDGNSDSYEVLPKWSGDNDDPNCYVQNFKDGRIYELKETTEYFSCANPVCVSTRTPLTCQYEDLPDNPGIFITEAGKSACQLETSSPKCKVVDAENFTAKAKCDTGTLQCLSSFYPNGLSDAQLCTQIGRGSNGSACPSPGVVPTCGFAQKSDGNLCKHLFPQAKGTGYELGDDEFGEGEENFWGTDPRNISTAGNGSPDEANALGLGITSFEWPYERGDKVGLVVEGDSIIKTKHNDGRKMRMWAFSKNTCSAIKDAADERSFYIKNSYGLQTGILTIDNIDLNDCLEENLLDPIGINESSYLDVDLSIFPVEPINDPLGVGEANKGNVVTANAIVNNSKDISELLYEWEVEVSSDGTANPPLWRNITDKITEHSYFSGLGNSEFNFKLNFLHGDEIFPDEDEEQHIRIKTFVSEGGENGRSGRGMAVVKVRQLGLEINSHKAIYSDTGGLSLGGKICASNNPEDAGMVCLVSNNEIIGLSIPDEDGKLSSFSWKINGEPLICDSKMSNECSDGSASNKAFFLAAGAEGDEISITADAVEGGSGLMKKFSKNFRIIKPYVRIISADINQVWPKQLGYFKNLDGTFSKDVSADMFQVIQNLQARLEASFVPDFIADPATTKINWTVNGENFSGNDKASFTASQGPGKLYNVSVNATYTQADSTRKALEKIWGISAAQTAEEKLEHSIQIEVVKSEYEEIALKNVKKFLANIASNAPKQAMFFLRLILTGALLVGISGLVFSLTNKVKNRD